MTTRAQEVLIAETCGWICFHSADGLCDFWLSPNHGALHFDSVPQYTSDFNAILDAENVFFRSQKGYYNRSFVTELCGVLGFDEDTGMHDKRTIYSLLHATAAQRAEAFLRTVGKWKNT